MIVRGGEINLQRVLMREKLDRADSGLAELGKRERHAGGAKRGDPRARRRYGMIVARRKSRYSIRGSKPEISVAVAKCTSDVAADKPVGGRLMHNPPASVVRDSDGTLSRVRRARVTFSRISEAFAVQMKGFGAWL